ncbi:hypothetical protein [Streptomyces sp. NPDC048172]|uniref:hypothetical protein n=1 Tax=Streptomyces sp. NPDC048172 TaxID=3365505 RepID=UPI00371CCF23
MTAASLAVLALALSGCSSDSGDGDGGDSEQARPKSKKTAQKQTPSPKASPSSSPTSASPSASASPSRTVSPSPSRTTPSRKATPSRTAAPAPSRPASGTGSVQGTWYYTVRDAKGRPITVTVRGTSWTAAVTNGDSCSGTISSGMAVTSGSCDESSKPGKAVLSEGGRKLTFDWGGGKTDRMQRTPPPPS